MVAPLEKNIRRLSGHSVAGVELTVTLVPGGTVEVKPLGAPRSEEVSVDVGTLYRLLRPAPAPEPLQTPAEAPDDTNHAVCRRLLELAAVALSPEESEAAGRERYLTTVRVRELVRRVTAEFSPEPPAPGPSDPCPSGRGPASAPPGAARPR